MKRIVLLTYMLSSIVIATAQNITASYKVTMLRTISDADGLPAKTFDVNYDGYLYTTNTRCISYLKPLYLKDYPDGTIDINTNDHGSIGLTLSTDTIQYVYYISTDSLIMRHRTDSNNKLIDKPSNSVRKFDPNYQNWQILPEIKVIAGFTCQRAKWLSPTGSINFDVWFCSDIPCNNNFFGLIGLPGLVIEGKIPAYNLSFNLQNYRMNEPINDAIFWPAEFNEPFRTLAPFRKAS
ncbi:MAG: GLPGLI family protein [Chitinophagaceae bacterium]